MRTPQSLRFVGLLALVAAPALAQQQGQLVVQLPSISFTTPPPLVAVEPGVQVVENYGDEIFVVDGVYWYRRGPAWYRAVDYRGDWMISDSRYVPRSLVGFRPGAYRYWRAPVFAHRFERPSRAFYPALRAPAYRGHFHGAAPLKGRGHRFH